MNRAAEGPPILLFLMMFGALLAIAICLAALAQADERAQPAEPQQAPRQAAAAAASAALPTDHAPTSLGQGPRP